MMPTLKQIDSEDDSTYDTAQGSNQDLMITSMPKIKSSQIILLQQGRAAFYKEVDIRIAVLTPEQS
jgi:hypothetical protein